MISHAKQSLKDKGLTLGCSCTGTNCPSFVSREWKQETWANPALWIQNFRHCLQESKATSFIDAQRKGKVNFIDGRPKKRQILICGSEKSPALCNKWDLEQQTVQGFITWGDNKTHLLSGVKARCFWTGTAHQEHSEDLITKEPHTHTHCSVFCVYHHENQAFGNPSEPSARPRNSPGYTFSHPQPPWFASLWCFPEKSDSKSQPSPGWGWRRGQKELFRITNCWLAAFSQGSSQKLSPGCKEPLQEPHVSRN